MTDPDVNIERQLALAKLILDATDANVVGDVEFDWQDARGLAEYVVALDAWVRAGGALPAPWRRST